MLVGSPAWWCQREAVGTPAGDGAYCTETDTEFQKSNFMPIFRNLNTSSGIFTNVASQVPAPFVTSQSDDSQKLAI